MGTDKHRLKKNIRKGFITFAICVFIYVVSYILNSFCGGYWLVPEMDGRDRYSFGLAMPTAFMWQPRFGHEALGDVNFFGAFYTPLIRFDRKFVHPTIYLSDKNFDQKFSSLKVSQVHPHWHDDFLTKITATAREDETNKVLYCTFHYNGSDYPRAITEIKMKRALADELAVSSPDGFIQKPYEGGYQFLNTNYIHWVGKLPLSKNQDITLQFPAKQPKAGTGRIVFYYQRTDGDIDSKNISVVELK